MSSPAQHGWIYVDKYGNRFMNEPNINRTNTYLNLSDFNLAVPEYTRIPAFIIFDETCRKAARHLQRVQREPSSLLRRAPDMEQRQQRGDKQRLDPQGSRHPDPGRDDQQHYVRQPSRPGQTTRPFRRRLLVSMSATNLANTINTLQRLLRGEGRSPVRKDRVLADPNRDAAVLRHGPMAGRRGRIRRSHPQRSGAGVRSQLQSDSETLQRWGARLHQGLGPRHRLTQRRADRVRADLRSQRGD